MNDRHNAPVALAAKKAGFSTATSYRLLESGELPSQRQTVRKCRRPDPQEGTCDDIVLPMLEMASGLPPIAIIEELRRRNPETEFGSRRTLERRVRRGRALHGQDREVIFRQMHGRDAWVCPTLPA